MKTIIQKRRAGVLPACLLLLGVAGSALATEPFDLMARNGDGQLPGSLYNSGYPAVTPDGRYVVFESSEKNLVTPASNGYTQIHLHDRTTHQTELVSVDTSGNPGSTNSYRPAISADGCKVVFYTLSSLVATDVNGKNDVYLRDRCTQPALTSLVSNTVGNGQKDPDISADGRYVVFDGNSDIYLHDLQANTSTLISESVASPGKGGNYGSGHPAISADGSRIAFWSFASDLVANDQNGVWDIFLWDKSASPKVRVVSVDSNGNQRDQGSESSSRVVEPAISADGRYVSFASTTNNLVPNDTNGKQDVFVKDTLSGKIVRASVTGDGVQGDGDSPPGQGERAALSADGKWVVFSTSAKNLTRDGKGNNVVAHNTQTGETLDFTDTMYSVGSRPAISGDADGRYVAFFSGSHLDTRFNSAGVFLHDRQFIVGDCLFAWLEAAYPALFAPSGASSRTLVPYTYRYYAQTNAYLAASATNNHLYYLGSASGGALLDIGLLSGLMVAVGCR